VSAEQKRQKVMGGTRAGGRDDQKKQNCFSLGQLGGAGREKKTTQETLRPVGGQIYFCYHVQDTNKGRRAARASAYEAAQLFTSLMSLTRQRKESAETRVMYNIGSESKTD